MKLSSRGLLTEEFQFNLQNFIRVSEYGITVHLESVIFSF